MAVLTDLTKAFYPTDFEGKVTLQDIVDTAGGGEGGASVDLSPLEQAVQELQDRVEALENVAE